MSTAQRKKIQLQRKKDNIERKELRERLWELSKPDPVLGHQMNEQGEQYWQQSDLCKILLTKDQVWGVHEDRRGNLVEVEQESDAATQHSLGPKRMNFGLNSDEDRKLLFASLPATMIEDRARSVSTSHVSEDHLESLQEAEDVEQLNAETLSRVLDLRNASGKGIQVENTRRIIDHFGTRAGDKDRGTDTGSVEVQVAVLTYRIRNLYEHLHTARHDNSNRRSLTKLVHQRASLLKYLRQRSTDRYEAILPRIGVEPRAVEGEIIVPGKPKMKLTM